MLLQTRLLKMTQKSYNIRKSIYDSVAIKYKTVK